MSLQRANNWRKVIIEYSNNRTQLSFCKHSYIQTLFVTCTEHAVPNINPPSLIPLWIEHYSVHFHLSAQPKLMWQKLACSRAFPLKVHTDLLHLDGGKIWIGVCMGWSLDFLAFHWNGRKLILNIWVKKADNKIDWNFSEHMQMMFYRPPT